MSVKLFLCVDIDELGALHPRKLSGLWYGSAFGCMRLNGFWV